MALTYSEALLAVLDACADSDEALHVSLASQLLSLEGIAAALAWGPPALATDVRLQAVAATCLGIVPQVGGLMWTARKV